MNCPKCNTPMSDTSKFCALCGAAAEKRTAQFTAPEGFVLDAASGLYYRMELDPSSGEAAGATWFNAVTGEYKQSRYDAKKETSPHPAAGAPVPDGLIYGAQGGLYDPRTASMQPQTEKKPAKRKRKALVAILLSAALLCAAGGTVWLTGLYKKIPFLNPPASAEPPAAETAKPAPSDPPRREPSIDQNAHVSTEFTVSLDDSGNAQAVDGILILFDGAQPEITADELTDAVLTCDGRPVPVEYEVIWTVLEDGGDSSLQTSYEILFFPQTSGQTAAEGTYAFSCSVQGVAYRAYDFYLSPPPEETAADWAAAYADFLRGEFYATKEYLHFSDWGVFPVHTLYESETAVMSAAFYNIPGFDYPVMTLVEFLPLDGSPDTLDTFQFEVAYLFKDGIVTWDLTEEESAAIYSEHEESGMTFVNGEFIMDFPLVSWSGGPAVEENLSVLTDWLDSRTADSGGASQTGDAFLELFDYTLQSLIDDGTLAGTVPDFIEDGLMYYRIQSMGFRDPSYVIFPFQDPPRPGELTVEALQMSLTYLLDMTMVGYEELVAVFGGGLELEQEVSEGGEPVVTAAIVVDGLRFSFTGDGIWYYDVYIERA